MNPSRSSESASRSPDARYGVITFLSAFLLFQVQLIAAKAMLPWFGGSASVWTTAVFFFQTILLAGYAYSHMGGKLQPGPRFRLHAALLAISLAWLVIAAVRWRTPITPLSPALYSPETPTISVLATLLVSIGLPFALLSTTSPLLQDWYARSTGRDPYWLYGVSNAGSLAGLLSYPFLVEPLTNLQFQAWVWAAAYAAFVAGVWTIGREAQSETRQAGSQRRSLKDAKESARAPFADALLWIALSATGSALFLATTNYLTQDVASVPLLWVGPLGLYLLSFVLTFGAAGLYRRWLSYPVLAVAMAFAAHALFRGVGAWPVRVELWMGCAVVLAGTYFCHGELARSKPQARHLTWFYLCMAIGGALGSLFVAVIAPRVFSDIREYGIVLGALALLAVVVTWRETPQAIPWTIAANTLIFGLVPLILALDVQPILPPRMRYAHFAIAGAWVMLALVLKMWPQIAGSASARRTLAASALVVPIVFCVALVEQSRWTRGPVLLRSRNFYGMLTIYDQDRNNPALHRYELYNGRILHGMQLLDPQSRHRATTYYGNLSGIGLILRYHPRRFNPDPAQNGLRVGLVGMGAGTLLIYEQPNDYFRVYELNPAVIALSRSADPQFTYLKDALGPVDVVPGDARVSLQREADAGNLQKFDVIALDAFSSDAIPVHLLTREALGLYRRHLRDDNSVIAVHITNYTLDLEPVVARLAADAGLYGMHVYQDARGNFVQPTEWILLTKKDMTLRVPQMPTRLVALETEPSGPLWTDSFSNLFTLLR